jgi:class 3 adenylate cyclase
MKQIPAAILCGVIALAAVACGDSPTSPSEGGRLIVRLSGSSISAGQALLVTFARVRAVTTSGAGVAVPFPNGASQFTCDLKKLQSSDGEIALGTLVPGDYAGLELQIQSATLYLDNSISEAACGASLRTPSGRAAVMAVAPSDVPLSSRFTVTDNGDTTMRIGLNTEQSVRLNGNGSYTFAPTMSVLSVG